MALHCRPCHVSVGARVAAALPARRIAIRVEGLAGASPTAPAASHISHTSPPARVARRPLVASLHPGHRQAHHSGIQLAVITSPAPSLPSPDRICLTLGPPAHFQTSDTCSQPRRVHHPVSLPPNQASGPTDQAFPSPIISPSTAPKLITSIIGNGATQRNHN